MLSPGSEPRISPTEFQLLARLVHSVSGISLGEQKTGLLLLRLGKRMRVTGDRSFISYYRRVRRDDRELAEMIDAITTNVTCFFREAHHFDFLLQELPRQLGREGEVRIWSAGCATGEEPYSIAAAALEALEDASAVSVSRVRILATDLCGSALSTAQAGIYRRDEVAAAMDPETASRCFSGSGGSSETVRVREEVRRMVRFGRLNLLADSYPFRRQFHFIFCRNVMIYFDTVTRMKLMERLHHCLIPGGFLFLGHSETVLQDGRFEPVGITTYRKSGA